MANKILIVVDMQNDFITGSLKNDAAAAIIPAVKARIEKAFQDKDTVIFTRDTHFNDYLQTIEGQHLPVEHCIKNTKGWEICPELSEFTERSFIINKNTFGASWIEGNISKNYDHGDSIHLNQIVNDMTEFELCGVCTGICVVSNALKLKSIFPNNKFTVNRDLCACVTKETHEAALLVMKTCHIDIVSNKTEE